MTDNQGPTVLVVFIVTYFKLEALCINQIP